MDLPAHRRTPRGPRESKEVVARTMLPYELKAISIIWARLSRNEHMPVGGLVAGINSNEFQALSDAYSDEVRSAISCRSSPALR